MRAPGRQRYLGGGLLLVMLWGGACGGPLEVLEVPQHYFDKTEADLEHGRPGAVSRYQRPRAVHQYIYDKTNVDLGTPLATPPGEEGGLNPPAATGIPPPAPLPGGDR